MLYTFSGKISSGKNDGNFVRWLKFSLTKIFSWRNFCPINIFTKRILSNNQNLRGKVTKFTYFSSNKCCSDKERDFEIDLDVEVRSEESVKNSVEASDDRNTPSVSDETTKKLLQGENNILILTGEQDNISWN